MKGSEAEEDCTGECSFTTQGLGCHSIMSEEFLSLYLSYNDKVLML